MTISLAISGTVFTYNASSAQLSGLGQARVNAMAGLQPGAGQDANTPLASRPGYIADDVAYLANCIQPWATANPKGITTTTQGTDANGNPVTLTSTFAVPDMIAQCLNSWSNTASIPPVTTANPLSADATKALLLVHTDAKAAALDAGELSITIAPGPPPVVIKADVSLSGRTDILSLLASVSMGLPLVWYQSTLPGGQVTLTPTQLGMIAQTVGALRATTVAVSSAAYAAINAGTITTTAQIDALPWPIA